MTAADEIGRTVGAWLATLDPGQRERAIYPFDDDERYVWAYTPGERGGLALADMRIEQRFKALDVVTAAMSERGAIEVRAIMALETVLGALEQAAGRSNWTRRDPELYWFAVFGDPASAGPWSWRIGGHHVAIHVAIAGGRIAGCTPSFLGSNPAVVPEGSTAGSRALTGEEGLARELLANLSRVARAAAVIDAVAPPDIHSGNGARADLRAIPTGIRYDELSNDEQTALERLIRHYLGRAPDDVAATAWERIVDAGLDAVTFAWAGPDEPGRGHYYAVRGPSFLLEYDNTQNGANHIHAVWRDLETDWGGDALVAHYRAAHREDG